MDHVEPHSVEEQAKEKLLKEKVVEKGLDLPSHVAVYEEFTYVDNHTDIYKMNTVPRGYCLIINMKKGREEENQADVESLRSLFEGTLKFTFDVYEDLTKAQIDELMLKVQGADHTQLCCFVMFILAHGIHDRNESACFMTFDDMHYKVSTIEREIENIPGLVGKPKLLFFHMCQQKISDHGGTSDFLISFAGINSPVAWRGRNGSPFIQSLCDVFSNHYTTKEVGQLMAMVAERVAATSVQIAPKTGMKNVKQHPVHISTLRKSFYFGKPPHYDTYPLNRTSIDPPPTVSDSTTIEPSNYTGKMQKWLKEGEVELEITRINMHGAPGAGKTCSLHLLLNEPPPSSTDSTPIACRAVQATQISIDDKNKKWERVGIINLLNQLASHFKEALTSTDDVPNHSDELSLEEPTSIKKSTGMEVIKEISNALEAGKLEKLSTNWVYFIDSGSQLAYRELLPLFTRAAALNIITIDLTKGLDEKCKFQYRIDQHMSSIDTDQKYSNRDIIQSTISSEAMLNPIEIPYVSRMPKHPQYLILGTRKELVTEAKLQEMNEILTSSFNLDLKNVIQNAPQESIIFPVDTLLPAGSKEREKASVDLCTAISNCAGAMTVMLPIRLFAFEIALQMEAEKKNRSFLTKKEVIEIGKSLRLDDESDINEALRYLHNVTILLYYPAVLPNLIFVDPKPILDVLSRLIAITSVGRAELSLIANPPLSADELNSLKNFGLLKTSIFEKIARQIFNKDFQPSHMIKLLRHLHIIARVKNREEEDYFFSCALSSYDKLDDPPTKVQPLLIAWEINKSGTTTLAIPQGLFPLAIVYLLEQDDVAFTPVGKGFYRCHNAMSLRVDTEKKQYYIDIINRYTHIELRFHGPKKSCPLAFELVTKAIKKSSKKLNVDKNHILAFKCPKNEHCYCIVQNEFFTRCTQCRQQCDVLQGDDGSYSCWFKDTQSFSSGKIEKWLKEGKVELKVTRINMHGAPGAGKTCSLHLLLNEPPPPPSTVVACPAVQATRISIDGENKWERVDIEDLLNQLASTAVDDATDDRSISAYSDKLSQDEPSKNEPTDSEVVKKILHAYKTGKSKKLSRNWVYFIDSGSQLAYRELLPLFTRAAALNIITIDLTKGLDEKCKFQYRIDQHMFSIDTDQKYSNRDIIQSTISSEAMLNPIEIPYVSHMPKHPQYLILGTRKELVTEAKLQEMNEILTSSFNLDLKNVIQNAPQESIIFPVDTLLPAGSKEREEASVDLCTAISNCAGAMTVMLPIRLFAFEIALQMEAGKKNRSFLTKKEVIEIGKPLQLDDESDIDKALQYLHNVTILLYYPAVLPNLIFVDPKPILDVLSRLIAITSVGRAELSLIANPPLSADELNSLKNFGLLKTSIFEKIARQIFNKDFQPSHMIKLLRHLHIIARVKNREEEDYFFSCALSSYDKLDDPPTKVQPLLIAWEINKSGTTTLAIPQGLFPLTIVHLLEQDDVAFTPAGEGFYRCHNAMSLRVDTEKKQYYIDIINRYTHIELRFHGPKESCPLAFELVTKAIKKSSKKLNVGKNHILAFKCPKNEHCYCIVKNEFFTRCTQCPVQCDVLQGDDGSYSCWFKDTQSFSSGQYTIKENI
uniref:Caspase family p20 domain-containing protein n=1 Tax=Amphimedon queenslandica TaxID=400682 RepID=A0A1X7TVQ6_AMPQE